MTEARTPIAPADKETFAAAAKLIRDGKLVAFPTETVYGLGADATSDDAVASVFAAKDRPRLNPLIVHVKDTDAAKAAVRFNGAASRLAEAFWPGALTLVLGRRDEAISALVSAGLETLAIRVPSHPAAQALLAGAGVPVAAPSANRAGGVSPTAAGHVVFSLPGPENGGPAMIVDGGPCTVGIESTVVDLSGPAPTLLRPGGIAAEDIEALIGPLAAPAADAKAAPMEERLEIAKGLIADMGYGPDNPLRPYIMMWCSQGSAQCSYVDHFSMTVERLRAIGIEAEWDAFETARAYDKAYAGEFDMLPWGFLTAMFDPDTWLYEHYYSTSDRNYGKYTNPEVDALIDLQSVTLDLEEREEIVKEISRILLTDNAKIPYYFSHTASIVQPWVKDWYWTNISDSA
ncbi:MAG: threonylcarbamoyl-AMP synthase [Proteobacteria bacterium]|nr:threonylcarbamoyl-AMP synthase [Pseudomonadota bacterium]